MRSAPIWCEVGYLPAAHGSAIFTRGETQALATVTLGTKLDEKVKDEVLVQGTEQFVLHYNFPPFSTGEAKAARGLSRREIGHGHLAWRALKPMIPLGEENPYAVRVVSDILESQRLLVDGNRLRRNPRPDGRRREDQETRIGYRHGADLRLRNRQVAVLSDILGDEDHLGDMDFKVTGTKDGITATQMDIKVDGLSYEVLAAALEQARQGRMHILGKITECIAEPRADYKPCVPRIVQITIPQDMIGPVIGPGGKVIRIFRRQPTPPSPSPRSTTRVSSIFSVSTRRPSTVLWPASRPSWPSPRSARPITERSARSWHSAHSSRSCPKGCPAPHLRDRLQAVRNHGGDRLEGG